MDHRYLKGIEHFNAREFYDAHEVWEELWHEEQGKANQFVQGLIQFATALHHFEAHNLKGAKILYEAGASLLEPYSPAYWGLPVRQLLEAMKKCFAELIPMRLEDLPGRYHPEKKSFPIQLKSDLIPKIELSAKPDVESNSGNRAS